jgi:hypothetical protein
VAGRAFRDADHRITALALVCPERAPLNPNAFLGRWRLFLGAATLKPLI